MRGLGPWFTAAALALCACGSSGDDSNNNDGGGNDGTPTRQPVRRRPDGATTDGSGGGGERLLRAGRHVHHARPLGQHGHRLQHRRRHELEVVPRDQRALGLLQLDDARPATQRRSSSSRCRTHTLALCATGKPATTSPALPTPPPPYTTLPTNTFDALLNSAERQRRRQHADRSGHPRPHQFTADNRRGGRVTIGILVTDGDPNGCDDNLQHLSNLLQAHYTATTLRTYVIGMTGATDANLEQIAQGGNAPLHDADRRARSRTRAARAPHRAATGTSATATRRRSSPRSPRSSNRPTAAPTAAGRSTRTDAARAALTDSTRSTRR